MAVRDLSVTAFLPYMELPSIPEGAPVQLHESGGKITLLVTLHSAECTQCRDYIAGLEPITPELDVWDGRLLVVIPGPIHGSGCRLIPFGRTLLDESHSIVDPTSASVLVADRYGQIFEAVHAGASHALPGAVELVEWLKYLGTLCPE